MFLSSGFIVAVPTQDCSSVIIQSDAGLSTSEYPALAAVARAYASTHQVSLEAYYFSDTNSGMFAFGTRNDTSQYEVIG